MSKPDQTACTGHTPCSRGQDSLLHQEGLEESQCFHGMPHASVTCHQTDHPKNRSPNQRRCERPVTVSDDSKCCHHQSPHTFVAAFTSAPASNSLSVTSLCRREAARINAVFPCCLDCAFTSAPVGKTCSVCVALGGLRRIRRESTCAYQGFDAVQVSVVCGSHQRRFTVFATCFNCCTRR